MKPDVLNIIHPAPDCLMNKLQTVYQRWTKTPAKHLGLFQSDLSQCLMPLFFVVTTHVVERSLLGSCIPQRITHEFFRCEMQSINDISFQSHVHHHQHLPPLSQRAIPPARPALVPSRPTAPPAPHLRPCRGATAGPAAKRGISLMLPLESASVSQTVCKCVCVREK